MPHRSLSIGAENTFTSFLLLRAGDVASVSVSGTFTGTVTLQRAFDVDGSSLSWLDVKTWTAAGEDTYTAPEDEYIRIGIKSSGYSNGSAVVCIGTARAQPWDLEVGQVAFYGGVYPTGFSPSARLRMTSSIAFASAGAGAFVATEAP